MKEWSQGVIQWFSNVMYKFSPDSTIFYGSPCLQELQKNPLLLLAEVSSSQLRGFGYPVQILEQSHSGYLKQQLPNQETPGSSSALSVFSTFHLPPPVHSTITFSQPPPRSIAAVSPLIRYTQQQAPANTVEFKATESSGYGELLPPNPDLPQALKTLKEVSESDKRNATRARYAASEKGRKAIARAKAKYLASNKGKETTARATAKYMASDQGKESIAKYTASDKRKTSRAKYAASEKGRKARAKYLASNKGKETMARATAKYMASDKGKETIAKYTASDKRKTSRAKYAASEKGRKAIARARAKYMASDKYKEASARRWAKFAASDKGKADQAIRYTRTTTYRLAIKQGLSEELAREKAESAAEAKKAELTSVPPTFQSTD